MYYPYLRARQFELIALRELTQEGSINGFVTPILEPVKDSFNNIKLAFDIFKEHNQSAYLIVNPSVGQVNGDVLDVVRFLSEYDNTYALIKPAFHFNNNAAYIKQAIEDYNLVNCMLICSGSTDATDADFLEVINLPQIAEINITNPTSNRSLNRLLVGLGKPYLRLDDNFEKEARNSDFLDMTERKFSEEHMYYRDEGFNGFSDYTVLPSEFTDGGSAPRAVVIHLTYLKANNQIWMRHFTSDTNDSIANVQGKFAEAAQKAVRFCREEGHNNSAIEELQDYYDREHYPGLGTVKKISIKNHILVVSKYLQNNS